MACSVGGTSSEGRLRSHWCVLAVILALVLTGCATTQDRGDRAFEANEYNRALDHYEMAIEKGSRDPQLFYRAAQAAVRVGDFSLAERYYSRALRYGGGEEVARSLADFYISTSNYTKAVQVLQGLLETTDNPQAIFHNLGVALMYAGAPLDAESYLLIAQQMSPSDPVPYVNLGVLYDRHLRQPHLALGFYRCFMRLGDGGKQSRKISARVQALQMRYRGQDSERYAVECGEPYQPPTAPSEDEVEQRLGSTGDAEPDQDDSSALDDGEGNAGEVEGSEVEDDEQAPPVIYRQVDELPEQPKTRSKDDTKDEDEALEPAEVRRLAERAFSEQNYREVLRHLEKVPVSELDARSMALYGRSLAELGDPARAQRWLAGAVAEDSNPQDVAALFEIYKELGATEKMHQLCERFTGEAELRDVFEDCPKKKLIEHLEKKEKN